MDNNNYNQYGGGSGSYDTNANGGGYQPNNYYNNAPDPDELPMTMGEWLLTIILSCIPCVGLVMMLIWAFGGSGNVNRRNYARAMLILQVVAFVLYMLLVMTMGATMYSYLGRMGSM